MWQEYLQQIINGNRKTLARCISLIENEITGYEELMLSLPGNLHKPVIGITGPPGAGKSTLVDALIGLLIKEARSDDPVGQEKKVAVLCIDPSSPFNRGALLGDRIRMSNWYNHPDVFIRSLASRGSLGGLHPKIIEITELLKAASFDYIIVETVGVGQSEIEIAGLADITVVVTIPEAGDEIQTMKAGLMEIADIFVVNKADRPDADVFVKNLKQMLAPAFHNRYNEVPVIKTIASQNTGIDELLLQIKHLLKHHHTREKKYWLLAEKVFQLIQKEKMKDFSQKQLFEDIQQRATEHNFNIYKFVQSLLKEKNV